MRKIKERMPTKQELHNYKVLKPIAHLLADSRLWHLNRRTVASGVAIGVLMGFLPLPIQMLLAATVAIIAKANVPLAIVSTWITNPFTMASVFALNYYVGSLLLDSKVHFSVNSAMSMRHLLDMGYDILLPLYLGSLVVGIIVSSITYGIIRGWWRYKVVQDYHRRKRESKKQKQVQIKQQKQAEKIQQQDERHNQ